ncbi:sensor histidine kinase [Streptomyces sp. JJ36]|uniref:sensor histidine kinase n=1 Tax=Streptomyces sp. JJ36 TaxID=2736645 RepID=UPI002351946B|nr:hypothetical protein [Streptomyces sp. JJ36]MCF6524638.1 hypothetical protein [Streptomyces sp. JJ36]
MLRTRSAAERARAFVALATMLYRVSHLTAGLSAVLRHHGSRPEQWLVLGVALGTSVLMYGTVRAHRRLPERATWCDVLATGCLLPFVAMEWGGAGEASSLAWVTLLGGSASAAAAVALTRLAAVVTAVALLGVTHTAAYLAVDAPWNVTGGHLNSLVFSAVLARVFWWYLGREGDRLDTANRRALAAEVLRAKDAERVAHYRALHDTVLATLTALSQGGVDANSPEVRRRCARDAAYLRRLVARGGSAAEEPGTDVFAALEEAVRSAESLGLRVTAMYHGKPSVPGHVVQAVAAAVTEAFNNVHRHAGTEHAFLTVTGLAGSLTATVVDRGRGFLSGGAPEGTPGGFGLHRSVHARMREIGGWAEVDSRPGEGVQVALRWPR